jgi:pectinesterase
MKMMKRTLFFLFITILLYSSITAQEKRFITVAQDGSGDFKTIAAAIYSLPQFNCQRTVINVKNGVYNEKIRIERDYITIKGESRGKTIIRYSQLRSDWDAKKDSTGPGVINIYGDDIILEDLTVENSQPEIGPHAFAVYGFGTRTVILNCSLISKGADTVSLWDNKNGMYYHANCFFQGAVDFVCPRGWCYITDSKFYEVKKTASIWHAGGDDIKQKFVIKNSAFDGVDGWELGRHHYEAQFFLINCKFSAGMSSKPIYRVTYPAEPHRDKPFNWGPRYFFFNCSKEGESLSWIKDNLASAEGTPKAEMITPEWTFMNRWNPESDKGPEIIKYEIEGNSVLLFFNEKVTVIGMPVLKSGKNNIFNYQSGAGSDTIRLSARKPVDKKDLNRLKIINESRIIGNTASVKMRDVSFKLN